MTVTKYRKTPDVYPLQDVRVIDGDTIEARIALPFDQFLTKRIRLKGWWADETTGPWGLAGQAAKLALEKYVQGRALWLLAQTCRLDKYGRVIGSLLHHDQIVDPRAILGPYQLTEAEHKARRDAAARVRTMGAQPAQDRCPTCQRYIGQSTVCLSCLPSDPARCTTAEQGPDAPQGLGEWNWQVSR